MKKRIIIGIWLLILCLVLPGNAFSVLYKYVDKDGVVHFTDRPDQVPEQYRDQLKRVEKEITVEKPEFRQWAEEKFGIEEVKWQELLVLDPNGKPVGVDLNKLYRKSLIKSHLIIWLPVELVLLILAVILLLTFRNWPTRRGRRNSAISIISGYLVSSLAILIILVLPSARNFLSISQVYLAEIKSNATLDQATATKINALDQKLQSYQHKLP